MISPLVRRKRLAKELRRLRDQAGLSSGQLATRARLNRQKISMLENGHPFTNVADVAAVLSALGLDDRKWHELFQIADESTKPGWWESYRDGLGERQMVYVNLESGAETVREYNLFVVPGVLQTAEYIRPRGELTAWQWQLAGKGRYDVERGVAARMMRQQVLRRPTGPSYYAILDELVIRRAAASPEVMSRQLSFLAGLSSSTARSEIRVLPIDADLGDRWLPRSPFSLYTYHDPGDPTVAVVDTEIEDYVYIEESEVRPYLELYSRLEKAALSVEESARFLAEQAEYFANVPDRKKSGSL
jgi:transcriptional regulator with XRE-family HTH domain